jgi:acetyl-CoA acetyltransferase
MNKTDLIDFLRTPVPSWGDTKFDRNWRDATAAKLADALEAGQIIEPIAPLTDDEIDDIWARCSDNDSVNIHDLARAIEARCKIGVKP